MPYHPYSWKQSLKEYFVFSKTQRYAAVSLLFLIAVGCYFPFIADRLFLEKQKSLNQIEVTALKIVADTSEHLYAKKYTPDSTRQWYKDTTSAKGSYFYFDPNTATEQTWKRLGVRDKTIQTIFKYKSKGGRFYTAKDIDKIFGLRPDEKEKLKPWVRIETPAEKEHFSSEKPANSTAKNKTTNINLDINAADTTQWKMLRGIGSKLAARIVKYREALGGFYAIDQVGETWGLPDSTFQNIKPQLTVNAGSITRRNINTASAAELKSPYIAYNVANAIVQYRNAHGAFKSINDLKSLPIIDDALFKKIAPYLTTE